MQGRETRAPGGGGGEIFRKERRHKKEDGFEKKGGATYTAFPMVRSVRKKEKRGDAITSLFPKKGGGGKGKGKLAYFERQARGEKKKEKERDVSRDEKKRGGR